MRQARKCDDCGQFTRQLFAIWGASQSSGIDREVCRSCKDRLHHIGIQDGKIAIYARSGRHKRTRTHIPQPMHRYIVEHGVSRESELPRIAHYVVHVGRAALTGLDESFAARLHASLVWCLPEACEPFQDAIGHRLDTGESTVIVDADLRKILGMV